jgi:hypothetical protein
MAPTLDAAADTTLGTSGYSSVGTTCDRRVGTYGDRTIAPNDSTPPYDRRSDGFVGTSLDITPGAVQSSD